MNPYWIEWWCRQFGYGNCRSMPTLDAFILWGGTALALVLLAVVVMNRIIDRA